MNFQTNRCGNFLVNQGFYLLINSDYNHLKKKTDFPVYWYVIQEGCSNGLAQQTTQEIENEFNEILKIVSFENETITVYPNPFETSFAVNSLTQDLLFIQTLDGKFVGSFTIEKGENQISLPSIPKGMYICKLQQQVFMFKLLKL